MSRSMILAALCAVIALACLLGGGLFFVERPTIVRVAVATDSHSDYGLLSAAGKVVRHGHHPIRFKIVQADNAKAAAADLDNNAVDMAVVRTDDVIPAEGQTVVILHRDAAILVAPDTSQLKEVSDLAGRSVGVIGGDANRALLGTMLDQFDVASDAVNVVSVTRDTVAEALKSKQIDAVLVVGIVSGSLVQDVVKIVTKAGNGPPTFIPFAEADAVAQRSPAYETFEVKKGTFHGSSPQPPDDYDTLSVTHRLVANSALSDSVVADVTRFFLSERNALVAIDPIAQRVEAPSTDKGVALPTHAGSAAYIDDEEETFLDHYSDYIYLGAMFFGVLASGATAMFSRLNAQGVRAIERLNIRLVEILKSARSANSTEALDEMEGEVDEIVEHALAARGLDDRCLSTLGLALDQAREAIRDRRTALEAAEQKALSSSYGMRRAVLAE